MSHSSHPQTLPYQLNFMLFLLKKNKTKKKPKKTENAPKITKKNMEFNHKSCPGECLMYKV